MSLYFDIDPWVVSIDFPFLHVPHIMCVHGYSKSKRRDVQWMWYIIPANLVCVFFGTAIPTSSINLWPDSKKGGTSRISQILVLKCFYLWNHSSYELQTWHEYFIIILTTCAANSRPRPLPVWAWRAPASITFENHHFMPLFGSSPLGTGGLLRLLILDLWSRRSKLLTNWVWSARLSLP